MTNIEQDRWSRVKGRLRTSVGEDVYTSWFARMEADRLRHNYVGTEHLLLALLELEDGSGPLHQAGIDKDRVETDLTAVLESLVGGKKQAT